MELMTEIFKDKIRVAAYSSDHALGKSIIEVADFPLSFGRAQAEDRVVMVNRREHGEVTKYDFLDHTA